MKTKPYYPDLQLLTPFLLSCWGRGGLTFTALSNVLSLLKQRLTVWLQAVTSMEMRDHLAFLLSTFWKYFKNKIWTLNNLQFTKSYKSEIPGLLSLLPRTQQLPICTPSGEDKSSGWWRGWALEPADRGLNLTSSLSSMNKTLKCSGPQFPSL